MPGKICVEDAACLLALVDFRPSNDSQTTKQKISIHEVYVQDRYRQHEEEEKVLLISCGPSSTEETSLLESL